MRDAGDTRKQLSIKVNVDIYDELWKLAHGRETSTKKVSINDIVNEAIIEYVEKEKGN